MSEILTSYHKRGREEGREEGRAEGREEGREEGRAEGREEGTLEALQRTLCKLAKQKLGVVSPETETMILETTSIPRLEKALEQIFDLDNEQALWKMLHDKNE